MNKEFSNILKDLRLKAGFSQKQVYEKLGIAQSTFSSWETGKAEPPADILLKLCRLYGVDNILAAFGYDGYNEDGSIQLNLPETELIEKYRALDGHGKKMVDMVLDEETARMTAVQEAVDAASRPHTRIIPLFGASFAAGIGEPDFGNALEEYEVSYDSPADFAVRVNGDSMEPYLPDGSIQLGIKGTPQDGDVAALLVDGAFYIKQVCNDSEGNLYLFSLNRARKSADLTVWASAGSHVSCFGKIIMPKRVPLPLD